MRRLALLLLASMIVLSCASASLAPPVIVALSVSPTEIAPGDSATLLWNVTGATTVTIDQGMGDVPAAGTNIVAPAVSTTYTLTATNAAGSVTKSVTLAVGVILLPLPAVDTTPPTVPVLLSPAMGLLCPSRVARGVSTGGLLPTWGVA